MYPSFSAVVSRVCFTMAGAMSAISGGFGNPNKAIVDAAIKYPAHTQASVPPGARKGRNDYKNQQRAACTNERSRSRIRAQRTHRRIYL